MANNLDFPDQVDGQAETGSGSNPEGVLTEGAAEQTTLGSWRAGLDPSIVELFSKYKGRDWRVNRAQPEEREEIIQAGLQIEAVTGQKPAFAAEQFGLTIVTYNSWKKAQGVEVARRGPGRPPKETPSGPTEETPPRVEIKQPEQRQVTLSESVLRMIIAENRSLVIDLLVTGRHQEVQKAVRDLLT